ncbi:uncharacterized protein LOC120215111 [Hibiscus syriacus]|uniref:uncharacterized protein LOC120215111 n=1 Tax=Hibiscus syriacus TaxID=106335 RepID=UPI001921EB71|nr:uncharacterized protein LOC120215111 [Hibiscus syriacus]
MKNMQASVLSGCLTDITKSSVVSELGLHDPRKYDLPAKKHKSKQKEKHNVSEHRSGGGDAKTSKMKRRNSDQNSLRVSKRIKSESSHLAHEDCMSEHAGNGPSASNNPPTALIGKDQPKHSDHPFYNDPNLDITVMSMKRSDAVVEETRRWSLMRSTAERFLRLGALKFGKGSDRAMTTRKWARK